MATAFDTAPIPATHNMDSAPETEAVSGTVKDYDPAYPGSTPEAPYGYFPDGRVRRRRPRGDGPRTSTNTGGTRMPASEAQASAAAGLLAQMNNIMGLSLAAFGMPLTAATMAEANESFEVMAKNALLTDPKLCRQILSGGASSGKAGLIMAYGALGIALLPPAQMEMKTKRAEKLARMEAQEETYV